MSQNSKKIWFCIALLIVLGVEFLCWRNNGKGTPYFVEETVFQMLTESYISGYDVFGKHYVPTDGDPQIGYSVEADGKTASVCMDFAQPLPAHTPVQVFYAREGQDYSERRSVVLSLDEEADRVIADIPDGAYDHIRVDIDGEFSLDSIQATSKDPKYEKGNTDYAQLIFESCVLLALLLFVRWKSLRTDERERRLTSLRQFFYEPEKLSLSEKWYIGVCFVICFLWSCVFLSIGYGPDETMRYDIPLFIFENGSLPYGGEPSLIHPIWGLSYGFSISLPYLISAFFMRIASFYTRAGFVLLIAARFTSVLSYTGIVYYAIKIGKKKFSNKTKWIFVFIMTLTPQVVFLGSYVNLDAFALFTVMMIIDVWLDCMSHDWDRQCCVKLGLATGLCLISYKFAYSYLVGSVLLYCLWYGKNKKKISFSRFLCHGFLIIGVAFLISGWYFIRNAILYDGDFLSLNSARPYAEQYALPEYRPSTKMTMAKQGYSVLGMLRSTNWLRSTLFSFVSVLGGMNLFAHTWVYAGFLLIFSVGMISGVAFAFPRKKADWSSEKTFLLLSMLVSASITIAISVYYSWSYDFQPQGRYIIYALPFVAFLSTDGYAAITERIRPRETNPIIVRDGMVGLIGVFILFTLVEAFLHCVEAFLPSWR